MRMPPWISAYRHTRSLSLSLTFRTIQLPGSDSSVVRLAPSLLRCRAMMADRHLAMSVTHGAPLSPHARSSTTTHRTTAGFPLFPNLCSLSLLGRTDYLFPGSRMARPIATREAHPQPPNAGREEPLGISPGPGTRVNGSHYCHRLQTA